MKTISASAVLLLAFAANAQAPTNVPIPQEPHHHLVLENEYVRVFRVSVPAHAATLLHQHDVPYIYVALGAADVINAVQGKPEARLVMTDGQVGYSRGGFAHIARNESVTPFNNVTIELLHPQENVHNLCEKIMEGDLGECQPVRNPSMSGKPYLESGELLIFAGTLKPAVGYGDIARFERLLVALDKTELTVNSPGQPYVKMGSGEVLWLPANRMHTITNLGVEPARYLSLLFKDSGPAKRP